MPQTLNDVPQSGQTLGITQPLIRNNFTTIDTAFQVDHVPYSTTGQGKHNKVTMPVQAADPVPGAGEAIMYNKLSAVTAANEVWISRSGGTPVPITASTGNTQNGYTYFPSGIILQYGYAAANGNGVTSINFNAPGFTTAPFSIVVTEQSSGSSTPAPTLTVGTSTSGAFNVKNSGAAATFYWFAIGR